MREFLWYLYVRYASSNMRIFNGKSQNTEVDFLFIQTRPSEQSVEKFPDQSERFFTQKFQNNPWETDK